MADNTLQRKMVATQAVRAVTALADALYELVQLADQRARFISPFADSDFTSGNPTSVDLSQLSAAMVGTLFDFVLPSLQTWYADTGNDRRNQQILLQMRAG